MAKFIILLFIVSLTILLNSCGTDSGEGKPVNIYGGSGRANSFEDFGSFYYKYPVIDKIEFRDSSGAIAAPLVLPNSDIIISTVKGNILLISQKQVRWPFKLDSTELPSASLAADANMNIYFISSIIQNLIPFFALPIITMYIIPSEYSLIAMFGLMISFFSAFVGINSYGAISRKFIDRETLNFPVYIGNAIVIYVISIVIMIVVTFLFVDELQDCTKLNSYWLFMALLASSLQFFITICLTLLQMKNESIMYGIFNIIRSLFNTSLILLFVIFYNKGWEGYLEANILSFFIFSTISLFLLLKHKEFKIFFNYEYFIHILKFGIPLIPHVLGGIAIAMTDRILLINLRGNEETGIYQLGWQMALPISLLIESFKNGYIPWLFSKLKEKTQNKKVVIVTYLMILAIFFIATLFIFIITFIINTFFNELYIKSTEVIPYLIYGLALNGAYYTVGLIISYAEKTSLLAILTFSSGVLNFLFSYYLILENGMIGAAQGTFLAYLITFLMTWVLSSRVHSMPWFSFWKDTK